MEIHETAFDYLSPSDPQRSSMADSRKAFAELAKKLNALLPDGPDKTYVMRTLRTAAMWANVSLTRHSDGGPR